VRTDPGSVREEAERLVTTVLAAASVAARDLGQPHPDAPGVATGDRECCVCPLCKVIAAVRDPDPDFAERLATGAGDLAAAAANMLRAFTSAPPGAGQTEPESTKDTEDTPETEGHPDPWRDATRAAAPPPPPSRRKPMAKKAVKPPVQKTDEPETDRSETDQE